MVVFHPSSIQTPSGRMNSFLGDTIKREFLVNPDTADAVLGSLGIRREPYERAQSEEEIKVLLQNDINKLKSFLSGPGMTDNRFKEGVRDQPNRRFGTTVINGIQKQQWQQFILRADDVTEYERMKANISGFKTGALYSSYHLDDANMAVIIEATNTVMTLDKQVGDDSVRVANMKGKDGKPLNYSENNLYGSIADNSNWIAADIYTWMRESGFEPEQMISERKYEMGAKPKTNEDRPVSFKEGKRHAIEFLQKETNLLQQATEALQGIGVLVNEAIVKEEENITFSDIAQQTEETLAFIPTEELAGIEANAATEKHDNHVKDTPKGVMTDIEARIDEALQKSVTDKMTAESALILYAKELLPQYIEKFEKFLPYTTSFDMTQKKVWDEFRELRNHPNAKVIEKHLLDFTLQRMFLLNKATIELQKENVSLQQGNGAMKQQLQSSQSEMIGLKASHSTVLHDLAIERETTILLQGKVEEYEIALDELQTEVEGIVTNVENLQAERDQLNKNLQAEREYGVGLKSENETLLVQLTQKNEEISKMNVMFENMSKTASVSADSMSRMEREIASMNLKNGTLVAEKEHSRSQLATVQEQLLSANRLNDGYMSKIKDLEAAAKHTQQMEREIASVATNKQEVVTPIQTTQSASVKAVEGMNTSEANGALENKIESIRSQIPSLPEIKVRPVLDRNRLKAATSNLKKMSDDLSKPKAQ